ncbi:hypothetical protein [uncultured Pseudomonas sp.]|uniref:hypothetical protein n=1 Tax=uncultured Pseudomonas sp. TaxID=114707 RepID=UPI0034251D71
MECVTESAGCRPCRQVFGFDLDIQIEAFAQAGSRDLQVTTRYRLHVFALEMPQRRGIATRRQGIELERAVFIGHPVPGIIGDVDVAEHPVVDVAAKHHQAGLVEQHRLRRGFLVEPQFEALGGRERIHLMTNVITVGEADLGAGVHGEYPGHELLIALVHAGFEHRRRPRTALEGDDRIGQRLALPIEDLGIETGRLGRGHRQRAESRKQQRGEDFGHRLNPFTTAMPKSYAHPGHAIWLAA